MKLTLFKEIDFLNAIKALFNELKVPVNYVTDEPTTPQTDSFAPARPRHAGSWRPPGKSDRQASA